MEKVLSFSFRGEQYLVNKNGHIKANGLPYFSPTWIFLGGSTHHWRTYPDVFLSEAFENPEKLNRCIGWDKDNGFVRTWGGSYNGKIPRIVDAKIITLP